jgi:hypothetical protein
LPGFAPPTPRHHDESPNKQTQMGIWWPAADSAKLRVAAQAWREMAHAIDGVDAASQAAVLNVLADNQGPATDAFGTYWQKWTGGTGYLPTCSHACTAMGKALDDYAQAVDDARVKVEQLVAEIGTAVVLGVVLGVCTVGIATAAAGAVSAGLIASAALVGVELTATAGGIIAGVLVGATFGAVEAMAIDIVAIQPEKILLFHDQKDFSWSEVLQWAEMGAAGGFVGGALGAGLGAGADALPASLSAAAATRLGRVALGGVGGAGTSVILDEVQYGQINPLDVAAGTVGGAAGGGIGSRVKTPNGPVRGPEFEPLPERAALSFRGGAYGGATPHVFAESEIRYRVGTAGHPLGEYYSTDRPVSEIQARIDKAIPPEWPGGQPAPVDTGFAVRFPAGTVEWDGEVASQGGWYMGGTNQVYIPHPWTLKGVEVVDSWPLR